jgi:hypothetical protein
MAEEVEICHKLWLDHFNEDFRVRYFLVMSSDAGGERKTLICDFCS